jgi:nucleolar GTP-binding protein
MNFPQVLKSDELLEILISNIKKDRNLLLKKNILKYVIKFQLMLTERLESTHKRLPDYTTMNPYYLLMCRNILEEKLIEKYKSHYSSTLHVINLLSERFKTKLIKSKIQERNAIKKEYLGRIASMLKRLDRTNKELLKVAKDFRNIPKPDKNAFTICLIGLPNAGKTTLLTKITLSNPEINSYEFTTKSLNFGYFTNKFEKIQVIDTPGLIHTEYINMNKIEKHTIIAIKSLADIVIYLYNERLDDKKQLEMFEEVKSNNPEKKIYVFENIGKSNIDCKNITIKEILNKEFN